MDEYETPGASRAELVAGLERAADLAQRRAVAEVRQRFPRGGVERDRADAMLIALSRLHLDLHLSHLVALAVLAIEEADRWSAEHPG